MFKKLFYLLTQQNASSEIVRCAITFLDIWQAVILFNHNYWIPELVNVTAPVYYYTLFICIIAILAVLALILHKQLWLSLIVLGVNFITYAFLALAGISSGSPPKASVGFSIFVMLISISAFWRILLLMIRDRVIRKRT
jgi:hypothetical protein